MLAKSLTKKGTRVYHPDFGYATIVSVHRSGAIRIRLDEGTEGTTVAQILEYVAPNVGLAGAHKIGNERVKSLSDYKK